MLVLIDIKYTLSVIALSHIHISAAYRSSIYENFETPRSEPYFAAATYVPRTCDVTATFPGRICDVFLFVWNFSFVCTAYQGVCAMYVWHMRCMCDVSTFYSYLRRICFVPIALNTYEN